MTLIKGIDQRKVSADKQLRVRSRVMIWSPLGLALLAGKRLVSMLVPSGRDVMAGVAES